MVANSRWPMANAIQQMGAIVNLGGKATVWQPASQTLTRPNNATAYAAGNAIGSSASGGIVYTFPGFFWTPGCSGILIGLRYVASVASIATSNMGTVLAHLYLGLPSAVGTLVDGNMYPTKIADDPLKLGIVQFSNWYQGGTGSDMIESYGQTMISQQHIIGLQRAGGNAADDTLYVVPVANGAFTPIANAVNYMYASAVMDG